MNSPYHLLLLTAFSVASSFLYARDHNLTLWISSFQDQSYYEQMAELYAKKSGEEVNLQVEAYGFREMPDKLGAVMRTGDGVPI